MSRYFNKLNYTLGDEDTSVELSLLPTSAAHAVTVAGSGGRALPLLAKNPQKLTCVDSSRAQLDITRMRFAALRVFEHERFLSFWGYPPREMTPEERRCAFLELPLEADVRQRLESLFEHQRWRAPLYYGRFEKTLIRFSGVVRLIMGARGRRIFECKTLYEQQEYYNRHFPKRAWQFAVFLLGNSTVLNALLYGGDFPKKNIDKSAYQFYTEAFDHLFRNTLARESFFLNLLFFGRIAFREGGLLECDEEVYRRARKALASTDIAFVEGDIIDAVNGSAEPVDFLSLSDVPSFLSGDREQSFLRDLQPGLTAKARVVTRGHLRVAQPDTTGFELSNHLLTSLATAEKTQLWHIHVFHTEASNVA